MRRIIKLVFDDDEFCEFLEAVRAKAGTKGPSGKEADEFRVKIIADICREYLDGLRQPKGGDLA
jgi:hypothetical protein